jgi:hypothetical protein
VQLEGVTVVYGRNRAVRDVTARFASGAVGLLGPERRRQEHDAQGAARLREAGRGAHVGARARRGRQPLEIRARIGYMPETDAHIPA